MYQKLYLNWEGKGAKEYKLQASIDGKEWTDITHATDKVGGIDEYEYTDTLGRYVRMQGIEVGSDYGYSLWEFEVYGERVDQGELKVVYNLYKYMNVFGYTPASVEKFTNALDNAKKVMANANADTTMIASAIQDLQNAVNELKKMADFDVLNRLIEEIKALDETKYTPKSWDQLQSVLNRAEEVNADKNSTQEVVDESYDGLKDAYDALMKVADKTDLEKLLNSIKDMNRSQYIDSSLALLDSTVNKVELILNDNNVEQEEVQKAYNELDKVVQQMVTRKAFDSLEKAIKKAEAIHKDDYTKETVTILEDMLKEAKVVIGKDTPLADEVNASLTRLTNALDGLVKKVNKTQLKKVIDEAEKLDLDMYTTSSVNQLKFTLKEAKAVLEQENASQETVDKAVKMLKDAMNSLVKKANKEELISIIDKAETINRDDYTKESLDQLDKALVVANAIVDDENALQDDVDNSLKAVKTAYDELVKKDIIDSNTEGTNNQKPVISQPNDNVNSISTKPIVAPTVEEEPQTSVKEEIPVADEETDVNENKTPQADVQEKTGSSVMMIGGGIVVLGLLLFLLARKRKEQE